MECDIFVSFRTDDTGSFKDELVSFLKANISGVRVLSSSSIPTGDHWEQTLNHYIDHAKIMIVLAGPRWECGKGSRNLLKDPTDMVRKEVTRGLEREGHGLHLITILIDRDKLDKRNLSPELHLLLKPQYTKAKEADVKSGLLNAIAAIYSVLDKHRPKPIVLISSTLAFLGNDDLSTEGLDYFTTLVMAIIQRLKTVNRDVILKVPIYSDSAINPDAADNQKQLLDETVAHLSDYSGIIIAPFDLDSLRPGIVNLLSLHPNFPFATIDKSYDREDAYFQAHKVAPPVGFVCDGNYNGKLAAQSFIRYIRQSRIANPNIVIIQGLQGSADRISGFIAAIRDYNQKALSDWINIFVSKRTDFIQSEGDRRATEFLDGRGLWLEAVDHEITDTVDNQERSSATITGFFCCNDEIALGVRNCLERRTQVEGKHETSVIVGFDGITSVKKHIQNLDPWLLDSVDVQIGLQVKTLVRNFIEALTHRHPVALADRFKGELLDKQPAIHIQSMARFREKDESNL